MNDASLTIFGIPVAIAAAMVSGCLGIVGVIVAAKINNRKSDSTPMPTFTFGYAHPGGNPQPPAKNARGLRSLSVALLTVAVLLLGWIIYGQVAGDSGQTGGRAAEKAGGAASSEQGGPTEIQLVPTQAKADVVSNSARLACTQQEITYTANNLIDQNPDTAWWASTNDDGIGRFAVVTFASTVHLTRVGLIPGYTSQAPRKDRGCQLMNSFVFNRHVESVRYDFDDGKSVTQRFQPEPHMQTHPVDTITRNVRITILGTRLPQGADNDTLISDSYFAGSLVH